MGQQQRQQQQGSWRPGYSNNQDTGNCAVPRQPFMGGPQSTPAAMCGSRFGSNPRQNGPPEPMNTNFSRPPPMFQSDGEFRPENRFTGPNQWGMAPVGGNQQSNRSMNTAQTNANNLPANTGNHSLNIGNNMPENEGNQVYNQWQGNQTFNQGQGNPMLNQGQVNPMINQGEGNTMLNHGQGNPMFNQGQGNSMLNQERSVGGVGNQRFQFMNANAGGNVDSYGFQPGQGNVSSNAQTVCNQQPPNSRNQGQNPGAKKFQFHSLNPTKSSVPHEAGPTGNHGRYNHNYDMAPNNTSHDNYRSDQADVSAPNGNVAEQQSKFTATRFMPDFHSNPPPGQMGYNTQQSNFTGPGHDGGISHHSVHTNIANTGVNNGPVNENEKFVQNHNFSNTLNQQPRFQQQGGQYGPQGFQNNSGSMEQRHQTTGQNGVNLVGNSSVGYNQVGNMKNHVMDHRYIQNDSENY